MKNANKPLEARKRRKTLRMKIFLIGVNCIGTTTIGAKLAVLLDYPFFDLDEEIETFFGTSIERLQNQFLTIYSFRKEASKALKHLLSRRVSKDCVIALPPSGLMDNYWRIVKKVARTTVVLKDKPENILQRITFYDIDSRQIEKHLTKKEKLLYLKEIKKDITYFRRTYARADLTMNITGLGPDESAKKIKHALGAILQMKADLEKQRTGQII